MDKHIRMLENVLRKKDASKTKEVQAEEDKGKEEGQESKTSAKASPSSKRKSIISPLRLPTDYHLQRISRNLTTRFWTSKTKIRLLQGSDTKQTGTGQDSTWASA